MIGGLGERRKLSLYIPFVSSCPLLREWGLELVGAKGEGQLLDRR